MIEVFPARNRSRATGDDAPCAVPGVRTGVPAVEQRMGRVREDWEERIMLRDRPSGGLL